MSYKSMVLNQLLSQWVARR